MKIKAFTLIELLVVIAIIALLMGIMMPALQSVRKKASVGVCLSNTKNLALGWFMYLSDNDDRIMSANDNNSSRWIDVPEDENGNRCNNQQTSPIVSDEDEIRGIKKGLLFPYVKSHKVYHCPGSKVKSIYDKSRIYVSYSIPYCLNGQPTADESRQIKNYNKIKQPSIRYVFVEASETRNWNQSHHFMMAAPELTDDDRWGWWGPMAINHGDSSVLGFCDGHSEVRKWRDQCTIDRVDRLLNRGGGLYGHEYPPADQTSDIEYMARGWAFRYEQTR